MIFTDDTFLGSETFNKSQTHELRIFDYGSSWIAILDHSMVFTRANNSEIIVEVLINLSSKLFSIICF